MPTKEEIKSKLPRGYLTIIAAKAKVTRSAVTRYFNGSTKSSPAIEKAALECAIEYQTSLKQLVSDFKSL